MLGWNNKMQVLITAVACSHPQVVNLLSAQKWVVAHNNWFPTATLLDESIRPLLAATPADPFLQSGRSQHCPKNPEDRGNRPKAQPRRQRADKTGKLQPVKIVLVARKPQHKPSAPVPAARVFDAHYVVLFIPPAGATPAKSPRWLPPQLACRTGRLVRGGEFENERPSQAVPSVYAASGRRQHPCAQDFVFAERFKRGIANGDDGQRVTQLVEHLGTVVSEIRRSGSRPRVPKRCEGVELETPPTTLASAH